MHVATPRGGGRDRKTRQSLSPCGHVRGRVQARLWFLRTLSPEGCAPRTGDSGGRSWVYDYGGSLWPYLLCSTTVLPADIFLHHPYTFFCCRRYDRSTVRTQIETNKKNGTGALSDVSGNAIARPTWPTMEDLPGRASPDLCGHSGLKTLIDRLSCNRATSSRNSF